MVPTLPTVSSLGNDLGRIAARHIDSAFRSAFDLKSDEVTARDSFIRVLTHQPHMFGNFAAVKRSDDLDSVIEAASPLAEITQPSGILFPFDPVSPEAHDWLELKGFVDVGSMPAMAVDIEQIPMTALSTGYEFARVGADQAEAWIDALAAGYEIPAGVARLFVPPLLSGSEIVQGFAAMKDGKIDAVSMSVLADGVAGIYCVATVDEARGQGLGAFVTAEPLRLAAKQGYRVGVLQSSEMGYSVYEKLGFATVSSVHIYARNLG